MPQQTNTKVEPFIPTPLTKELTPEQHVALDAAKADKDLLARLAKAQEESNKVTFGDGRYSNAMGELYKDSHRSSLKSSRGVMVLNLAD